MLKNDIRARLLQRLPPKTLATLQEQRLRIQRRWASFPSMTSDERTLIVTLFDRLNQAAAQPKDAEADEFIRARVTQQPSAPYLLVQSTLVMQQALTAAQSRIADLEKQLAASSGPNQEASGSFLSGMTNLFGAGQSGQTPLRSPQTPPPLPPQPSTPSTFAPPPIPQAGAARGGGFLQNALSTAAGVAGGALLFQGIQNLMGHNPGPFAGLAGPSGGLIGGNPPAENTEVVNNIFEAGTPSSAGSQPVAQDDSVDSQDSDPRTTAADPDPGSDELFAPDDGGGFFGDDDSLV